jgi:malonyl-CoA O-methyltransferase
MNFNKQAKTYLNNLDIQLKTANLIFQHLSNIKNIEYKNCIDLGCGPSTFKHTQKNFGCNIINIDLSKEMLKQISYENKRICADTTMLPLQDNISDIIISNLMIQWIKNKNIAFSEMKRVSKPNGIILGSTLLQDSLLEINTTWKKYEPNTNHTLEFWELKQYLELFNKLKFNKIKYEIGNFINYFDNYYAIMKHFKKNGTNIKKSNSGLYTKNIINKIDKAYRYNFGTKDNKLPVTYKYLIFQLEK